MRIKITEKQLNILTESQNLSVERYINKLSDKIKPPYIHNLRKVYDVPREYWDRIMSYVFAEKVSVGESDIYNDRGKQIYHENETSEGYFWFVNKYNSNNNIIYYKNSDGVWSKWEYDKQNRLLYQQKNDGSWEKAEYDKFGNLVYNATSDGWWVKNGYNKSGDLIYKETSEGVVLDKRIDKNISESIVNNQEKFLNKIVDSLIKNTNYEYQVDKGNYDIYPPFGIAIHKYLPFNYFIRLYSEQDFRLPFFDEDFLEYCEHNFGLSPKESEYVWENYVISLVDKIMFGKTIV